MKNFERQSTIVAMARLNDEHRGGRPNESRSNGGESRGKVETGGRDAQEPGEGLRATRVGAPAALGDAGQGERRGPTTTGDALIGASMAVTA